MINLLRSCLPGLAAVLLFLALLWLLSVTHTLDGAW